ncbi:MAG: polyhydroxyalkanoic acid system family protein [Bdellovibrionota bacterium]
MAKFKFEVPAPLDSATAYSKIKTLLKGENDFKKFDPNVSCTFDEAGQACKINGKQFKADLQVKTNNPKNSTVTIEVEVPFALSLFKGKIQDIIEKNLKRIL